MVGWHNQLNGHEFEQTLEDSEGQGSMVCCSAWGCKESDPTEQLNNNDNMQVSQKKKKVEIFQETKCIITLVVHSLSHIQLFVAPWTEASQASLFCTISQSLLKFVSIESVILSNHSILCCSILQGEFL